MTIDKGLERVIGRPNQLRGLSEGASPRASIILQVILAIGCLALTMTGSPRTSLAQEVHVEGLQILTDDKAAAKVCFHLEPFSNPKVFPIQGDDPKIVVDVPNVVSWNGKPSIPVDGAAVRQVRSYLHRDEKRLRIVLDLVPNLHYAAEPLYYEAERIYCIAVSAK